MLGCRGFLPGALCPMQMPIPPLVASGPHSPSELQEHAAHTAAPVIPSGALVACQTHWVHLAARPSCRLLFSWMASLSSLGKPDAVLEPAALPPSHPQPAGFSTSMCVSWPLQGLPAMSPHPLGPSLRLHWQPTRSFKENTNMINMKVPRLTLWGFLSF